MNGGAALAGALFATIARPATWPLGLAVFLIRGGILLVALPIVVLPTPVGLGNVLAPALTSIAFGSVPTGVVVASATIAAVVMAWVIAGGWLAAALEAEGVRMVAADANLRAVANARHAGRVATRVLAAHLLALLPLALALAWGSVRIVVATYRELTNPLDVSTPIIGRVLLASPEVVPAVFLTWMLGEIVGAIAARRIVLADIGVVVALRSALSICVRHPLSTLVRFWLPTLGLLAVLVPSVLVAGSVWSVVDAVLAGPADPMRVLASVILFVVLWVVGLLLTGVVCAWRTAVWTVADVVREGTFGGSDDRRPGHWRPDPSSAKV